MQKSWSHKLFLKINKHVGKNHALDTVMFLSAQYGVYALGFLILIFVFFVAAPAKLIGFKTYVKDTTITIVLALITSWIIGFIFQHRRPIVELPGTKELFRPISTWKSFPSDHAIVAFTAVLVLAIVIGLFDPFVIFFFLLATLIAFSRIYAGVHYPRDILGGIVLASMFTWAFWGGDYIGFSLLNSLFGN